MIQITPHMKILLAVEPVDFRKGIDGMAALCRTVLKSDPFSDWADQLVFIYPIWWGRPPAMLLGYIDQLFSTNFAYRNKGKWSHEGLLKGKSVICISTMKGPKNYPLFFLNNAHKALMRKAIFNFVGIKKVKFFEFGSAEKSEKKQKPKLKKVYNYFKALPA